MYKQITYKLRIHRGPGKGDKVSVRPTDTGKKPPEGNYTDLDNPTLIEFDEYDQVDIQSLLTLGAIEEYKPPKQKPALSHEEKEGKDVR